MVSILYRKVIENNFKKPNLPWHGGSANTPWASDRIGLNTPAWQNNQQMVLSCWGLRPAGRLRWADDDDDTGLQTPQWTRHLSDTMAVLGSHVMFSQSNWLVSNLWMAWLVSKSAYCSWRHLFNRKASIYSFMWKAFVKSRQCANYGCGNYSASSATLKIMNFQRSNLISHFVKINAFINLSIYIYAKYFHTWNKMFSKIRFFEYYRLVSL